MQISNLNKLKADSRFNLIKLVHGGKISIECGLCEFCIYNEILNKNICLKCPKGSALHYNNYC
jgi:hypothetical protein